MSIHGIKPAGGTVDVIVIGAGHAGLASSYCLAERGIDHVVLERGEVANSWRNERWDSLKLLTPNWQSRLPGYAYGGDDPDGFMDMPEVVEFIDRCAGFIAAPVQAHTNVTSMRCSGGDYEVQTNSGTLRGRSVILASGACNIPIVPKIAADLPSGVQSLTPFDYKRPADLDDGGVLIVGASATGLQLADEILASGRDVTIATGEHVRMPRTYRGRDIQFWLDRAGVLDERYDEVEDIVRARRLPSPQLVGSRERQALDLNALTDAGASLNGRLMGFRDGVAMFSGSLKNVCALADLKMGRMLDTIDEWAETSDEASEFEAPERFAATRVDESPCLTMNLRDRGISTVIWATGFRPDYSWLDMPILDRKGHVKHDGGITESPGLYLIGTPVLRRRKSSFIHGAEDDARDITAHLHSFLKKAA